MTKNCIILPKGGIFVKTRLSKWGTSLGIRIPKDVLNVLGWRENDKIEVARTGKKLTLENAEQSRIMTDWQKMTDKQRNALEKYYAEILKEGNKK